MPWGKNYLQEKKLKDKRKRRKGNPDRELWSPPSLSLQRRHKSPGEAKAVSQQPGSDFSTEAAGSACGPREQWGCRDCTRTGTCTLGPRAVQCRHVQRQVRQTRLALEVGEDLQRQHRPRGCGVELRSLGWNPNLTLNLLCDLGMLLHLSVLDFIINKVGQVMKLRSSH